MPLKPTETVVHPPANSTAYLTKNSPANYDSCSVCRALKSKRAILCRLCKINASHPPIDPVVYVIEGVECRRIPLTQGMYATVDATDYEPLMQHGWYAYKNKKFYARRNAVDSTGKRCAIDMHSFILGTPKGLETDHRNGDGIDNRRLNIRIGTHKQNMANYPTPVTNKNGYKGVQPRKYKDRIRYRARIKVDQITISLGEHNTEKEAAQAYDTAALKHFGIFARLNFPQTP